MILLMLNNLKNQCKAFDFFFNVKKESFLVPCHISPLFATSF